MKTDNSSDPFSSAGSAKSAFKLWVCYNLPSMPIPFCKFHGFGNDYIVIEKDKIPNGTDVSELAKAICHRHTGVGGDGIAVLEKLDGQTADFFCEIVNPDGSIAGFSG